MINNNTRIEINNKRYYIINDGVTKYFPSVTTILGTMSDQSGLLSWRKSVGEKKADEIGKFSSNKGTIMHLMNENFFSLHNSKYSKSDKLKLSLANTYKQIENDKYTKEEIKAARQLFYQFYLSDFFDKVKSIILQEQILYSTFKGGYAGQVDKVYLNYNNQIIITDYKSSNKPKKDEWITNYKMQASAYYVAYWERYKIKPHSCEIWISNSETPEPQLFELNAAQIKYWYCEFCKLLIKYHNTYDTETKNYINSQINK